MSDEKRRNAGQFKPGVSGNPSGSTRGVERMFREELAKLAAQDGRASDPDDKLAGIRALVKRAWDIAWKGADKDSIAALKFLTERAAGMPKQQIALTDDPPPEREIDWAQVPLEERRELLRALAKIDALQQPRDGATEH